MSKDISLLKPNLLVSKLMINCNSVSFLRLESLKLPFKISNYKIINIVIICIEMQWQRKKLFQSDKVCVIIKSASEITAIFSNI